MGSLSFLLWVDRSLRYSNPAKVWRYFWWSKLGVVGEVISWLNLWVIIMFKGWVGLNAKYWHYRYVQQAQTP